MPTYKLTFAYDGSEYHGYAKQPDVRSVQQELEDALSRLAGEVEMVVAGRTDKGVHAVAQVVSFTTERQLLPLKAVSALNKLLSDEIVVSSCELVPDSFSARFTAKSRTYHYQILNRPLADPARRRSHWHVPQALDVFEMSRAAQQFVGEHDFMSFCRKGEGRTTVRKVTRVRWSEPALEELTFEIEAVSFCHQMVRALVAVCIEVGRGNLVASDIPQILAAHDRKVAAGSAPAHGLTLWSVTF
jgi:tRNA pseudouridine38-40 synthase